MAFTTLTLTGTCHNPDGSALVGATVRLKLSTAIADSGSPDVVPAALTAITASDGTFSLAGVVCNDDTSTTPVGTFYAVTVTTGANPALIIDYFDVVIPHASAPSVDLFSLSRLGTPASPVYPYLSSLDGIQGAVTLGSPDGSVTIGQNGQEITLEASTTSGGVTVAATASSSGTLAVSKLTPCDATTGALSMALPTGQSAGKQLEAQKIDSTTNTVTLTGNIRDVPSASLVIKLQYEGMLLVADSTGSWWPMGDHKTLSSLDARYVEATELGAASGVATLDSGSHLTASQVPSSVANASQLVATGQIARVAAFGDSRVEFLLSGGTAPAQDLRWPSRLAGLFGAQEENYGIGGCTSYINSGSTMLQILRAVNAPIAAPYMTPIQLALVLTGINDLTVSAFAASPANIASWIVQAVYRLRAAGWFHSSTSPFVFAQGTGGSNWGTDTETTLSSGPSVKQANANGNTWQFTFPADVPAASTIRIRGFRPTSGGGAVHTITKNGSAYSTVDTRGGIVSYEPWNIPLVGSAGDVFIGTISSLVSNDFIDCAELDPVTPPLVVVCNNPRSPAYPTGSHVIVDSDVTGLNTLIASALSTAFTDGHVILADIDTLLNKTPAYFTVALDGGVHPNQKGMALIASYVYGLVTASAAYANFAPNSLSVPSQDVLYAPRIRENTNRATDQRSGIATLVAGTVTVPNRIVTANSRIQLTAQSLGTVTAPSALTVSARTAGTSFTILASQATDTSTVAWLILEPA